MFAVGHLALGYMLGKATSKSLNASLNVPLVLVASIISDIDLLIPGLQHRGPTHSLILIFFFFFPTFVFYRERAVPYLVAVFQHSIIGDYLTGGGIQLLWPLAPYWFGIKTRLTSLTNIAIEWILFFMFVAVILKTKDLWILFHPHPTNILLSIPILTVLLPMLISFPLPVPIELIVPHVVYLILFTFSILIDISYILSKLLP